MKRYFYTDTLAAAWMAKHFGMIIEHEFALCCDVGPQEDYGSNYAESVAGNANRHFINPDSLHLLTPQIGDIVLNCDEDPARVVRTGKAEYGHYEAPPRHAIEFVASGAAKIIQRNGKPFFWPEVE